MSDDERPDEWGELADRLDQDYPPAWIPGQARKDTGEVDASDILGTFVRMDDAQTRRNESAKVLVLAERATGELRSVWLLHQAVREKVATLNPEPGDKLAIRQLDRKVSESSGMEYVDYKVAIVRHAQPGVPAAPASLPTPDDDTEGLPPELAELSSADALPDDERADELAGDKPAPAPAKKGAAKK